jgi:hexosaminidase
VWLETLEVTVLSGDECPFPALDDDESYTLTLDLPPGSAGNNASAGNNSGHANSAGAGVGSDATATATLSAATAWGVLRGLETFAQLVSRQQAPSVQGAGRGARAAGFGGVSGLGGGKGGDGASALVVLGAPLAIADAPRYPWRGLLLDTANHFLPVATLEAFVEAMATVKMNVLHWHIVDSYVHTLAGPVLLWPCHDPHVLALTLFVLVP